MPPADSATTGALRVLISDTRTAAVVGEDVPYIITIENTSTVPDDTVKVRVRIGDGMEYINLQRRTSGTLEPPQFGPNGIIDLPIINYLRPGERITYQLTLRPRLPGTAEVRVEAASRLAPNTIQAMETTEIRAR